MIPKKPLGGNPRGQIGLPIACIVFLLGLALMGLYKLSELEAAKPMVRIHTEGIASTTPQSTVY
jgi:hypothetical protein